MADHRIMQVLAALHFRRSHSAAAACGPVLKAAVAACGGHIVTFARLCLGTLRSGIGSSLREAVLGVLLSIYSRAFTNEGFSERIL